VRPLPIPPSEFLVTLNEAGRGRAGFMNGAPGSWPTSTIAGTSTRNETAVKPTLGDGRPGPENKVFTLGYEGRDLEDVLQNVQRHRIEQVIDVREKASSRKRGFAAAELRQALAKIGVVYTHLPDLGCSSASRRALWRGAPLEDFLDDYRRSLAQRPEAFADLVQRIRSASTLILCMERDWSQCHRAVLSERLNAVGIFSQNL
jgi:hypothetical protein